MALGNKQGRPIGGKRQDQAIRNNLKRHADRMKELIEQGLDERTASRQAFKEITGYAPNNS